MSKNEVTSETPVTRAVDFWDMNTARNTRTRDNDFNDELEREIRNIRRQCSTGRDRDRDNTRNTTNQCCCKEGLRRSLDILTQPFIRTLIDLTSFRLIGESTATSPGTTIKSVTNCNQSTITFSDPATAAVTMTTICDLVALQFDLAATPIGDIDTLPELIAFFSRIIQRILPEIDTDRFCCKEEENCCCNQSKAAFFANSVGPVNIVLNTTSGVGPLLTDLTVITVTDNVAWFIDSTGTVFIVCLTDIVAFG